MMMGGFIIFDITRNYDKKYRIYSHQNFGNQSISGTISVSNLAIQKFGSIMCNPAYQYE